MWCNVCSVLRFVDALFEQRGFGAVAGIPRVDVNRL